MNFICTVSPDLPENYRIGLTARTWGVIERYERRIRQTSPGDLLLFSIGGRIRSLHRIESEVYFDTTELWPEHRGSYFPFRVRISDPIAVGDVALGPIADRISFLQGLQRWTGALQGPNGVFNSKLTDADVALIRSRLADAEKPPRRQEPEQVSERQFPIRLFQTQIEQALVDLLDQLGCDRLPGLQARASLDPDHYTLLGRKRATGATMVIVLDGGQGNSSVLLHALRDMSRARQRGTQRSVEGLILTGRVSDDLWLATREIPNLDVRKYQLRLELAPDPDSERTNGFNVA